MKTKIVVLALLMLCFSCPAAAQYPRAPRPPLNTTEIRDHLAKARFSRTVVVDAAGRGDFKKLSDALTYVSTQARSVSQQWTVLVYGGGSLLGSGSTMNYVETRLTVPTYTTVRGFPGAAPSGATINSTSNPTIELTGTSGILISLAAGSGLSGLNFYAGATLTADTIMADAVGNDVVILENVQLWFNALPGTFNADIFVCEAISCSGYNFYTARGQNGSSATVRNVVAKSSLSLYGGRHLPGSGQAKLLESASGGTLRLFWVRLIPGATTDLAVTGGGTAENHFSVVANYTGTVKGSTPYLINGTANPSTCSPGQLFLNTTGGTEKICACISVNTWRCAPLS